MKRFSMNTNMIALFFILLVLAVLIFQMKNYDISDKEMGTEKIEEIIRHYATTCYALEGSYPSSLEYLQKNYGLIINEDQYAYHYDAFASNILPDIKVLKKAESEAANE